MATADEMPVITDHENCLNKLDSGDIDRHNNQAEKSIDGKEQNSAENGDLEKLKEVEEISDQALEDDANENNGCPVGGNLETGEIVENLVDGDGMAPTGDVPVEDIVQEIEDSQQQSSSESKMDPPLSHKYTGFTPTSGVTVLSDRVSTDVIPEAFFGDYIQARRPAVISDLLNDQQHWEVDQWSSDEYLLKKAGNVSIYVEEFEGLDSTRDGVEISYSEFVKQIQTCDSDLKHFLSVVDSPITAAELENSDDVVPSTISEPLTALLDDFPCRPAIFGKLVPRRISLSQGHLMSPGSGGLQHDFHDRFCLALRGCLRFRLFPPTSICTFLSTDCTHKIYPNGLVIHAAKCGKKIQARDIKVRADGAPFEAVARLRRDDADDALAKAEKTLYRLRRTGVTDRTQLEKAMDTVGDCENDVDTANEELHKWFYSDSEYDDDDDDENEGDKSNDVISIHDDDSDPEMNAEPPSKVARMSADVSLNMVDDQLQGEQYKSADYYQTVLRSIKLAREDTSVADELFKDCPQFKDVPCIIVNLKPGELLYLPASWIYEVTTYNEDSENTEKSENSTAEPEDATAAASPVHRGFMSLVYLTFPPDGQSFDAPYADDFWTRRWTQFEREYSKMSRRSKLISSDVISLDSGESDNDDDDRSSELSSSSDSDSFDEDGNDEVVARHAIVTRPGPGHVDRKNQGADDARCVMEASASSAILVGDDDEDESELIDGDDDNDCVEELDDSGNQEVYDDDDDDEVVHLDTTHDSDVIQLNDVDDASKDDVIHLETTQGENESFLETVSSTTANTQPTVNTRDAEPVASSEGQDGEADEEKAKAKDVPKSVTNDLDIDLDNIDDDEDIDDSNLNEDDLLKGSDDEDKDAGVISNKKDSSKLTVDSTEGDSTALDKS